jgi:hypothetical protein
MAPTSATVTYPIESGGASGQLRAVVESVGVSLFRSGKELRGLCPFHADKNPSFVVNPEKNRWYCFACAVGGDAIRFVEKFHGLSFKDALSLLGLDGGRPPQRAVRVPPHIEWAKGLSQRICDHLRDIGDEIRTCGLARKLRGIDRVLIARHEAALIRQWSVLVDLDDDLNDPKTVAELWKERETIDAFIEELK